MELWHVLAEWYKSFCPLSFIWKIPSWYHICLKIKIGVTQSWATKELSEDVLFILQGEMGTISHSEDAVSFLVELQHFYLTYKIL